MHLDARRGQPKTQGIDVNVDRVWTLVLSDQKLSVWLIAEELNMHRETVRQILTEDLGMKIFPHRLCHPFHISSDLLNNAKMFDKVFTGD